MLSGWIGITIGLALVGLGYSASFRFPVKSENPDDSSSHLKYLHIESFLLIFGGLFISTLSLWLLDM